MNFDLAIIGFGVIGTETIDTIRKKLKNYTSKKKFKVAIIDKNFHNVPGGIAYNISSSKYGFFNNPLRLSHPDFIKWINIKKNIKKLISFINDNPDYNLQNWLLNNIKKLNKKTIDNEIYFPRLAYSFYLNDKILKLADKSIEKKILIKLYEGNINKIITKKNNTLLSKNNLIEIKLKKKNQNLEFQKKKILLKKIISKSLVVGNGLIPPKIIPVQEYKKNKNYIWDFYSKGGTGNLKQKIKHLLKNKNSLNIVFIGNKAGLLENLIELRELILIKKKNINLISISNSPTSLEKAELSKNYNKYECMHFTKDRIGKINKAENILKLLTLEFNKATKKKFNKYDVWTKILSKKLLNKCYNNLSKKEKNVYNIKIFPKIRNLTRYTFPETVNAMNELKSSKKLKNINGSVKKIIKRSNFIHVETNTGFKLKTDILVNVSGPAKVDSVDKEDDLISSLKNISRSYNFSGFNVKRNFLLKNLIFLPGVISNSFNPYRQTIIKAITNNVKKVCKKIIEEYMENHATN